VPALKIKVKDLAAFENKVFGADCFLRNFPEILTTGVEVKLSADGFYYIVDKTGKPVNDTTFFSREEMDALEQV